MKTWNNVTITEDDLREDGETLMLQHFNWVIVFVLTPMIAVLGVMGNLTSVTVLIKLGLRKSSDILLVALAVSDISYMIGANSPAKLIYQWGRMEGFAFSESVSRVCFYIYHLFDILDWGGGHTSVGLPVFITLDRLIAVFFPLKFKLIVTRHRTLAAVLLFYAYSYGIQIYIRFWYKFKYTSSDEYNVTIGLIDRSELFWAQQAASKVIEDIYSASLAPLIAVSLGCLVIGIKLKLTALQRAKMTRREKKGKSLHGKQAHSSSHRTTKTLLSVCGFYCITCVFISLPSMLPKDCFFPLFSSAPSQAAVIVYNVLQLILCVNATSNFVIYVVMNRNFRKTFLTLFKIKQGGQQEL
ncbi:G-protein coupled receptor F59B2.13 [Biomphalaria pfeifferi]|uniref:G-protein coupled receptor F59B2.13 n=1 Tax=Biomphalaria pfeifferi TaxID=112525 RepID=A0AAD8AZI3_BIOPF|nr:G-protein coupled receptor F59B2.13 [Biomphalaria pfeifferi]